MPQEAVFFIIRSSKELAQPLIHVLLVVLAT